MAVITDIGLWQLFRHLRSWLVNLRRAGADRQRQSIVALRAVIVAARQTQAYVRHLNDTGKQDHAREARLSERWTEIGFKLDDLGLTKLAKRCDIKGRYWADPRRFDADFLDKADVGLERMEQIARQLVQEIEKR